MRAKFIKESLMNTEPRAGRYTYMKEEDASLNEMNFEKGEDPRKTLGLELQYLEVLEVGSSYQNYYSEMEAKRILKSLSPAFRNNAKDWSPRSPWIKYVYDWPWNAYEDALEFVLTVDFMQDTLGRKFDYLKYKGDYFPIDHLVESVNFERGEDPRKTLRLSNKDDTSDIEHAKEIAGELKNYGQTSERDVAEWIMNNYDGLTGRDEDVHDEGDFPDIILEIIDAMGLDYQKFEDEWGLMF
jgi:hypothetical protein